MNFNTNFGSNQLNMKVHALKYMTCRIGYLIQQVIPVVSRDPDAGVGKTNYLIHLMSEIMISVQIEH